MKAEKEKERQIDGERKSRENIRGYHQHRHPRRHHTSTADVSNSEPIKYDIAYTWTRHRGRNRSRTCDFADDSFRALDRALALLLVAVRRRLPKAVRKCPSAPQFTIYRVLEKFQSVSYPRPRSIPRRLKRTWKEKITSASLVHPPRAREQAPLRRVSPSG